MSKLIRRLWTHFIMQYPTKHEVTTALSSEEEEQDVELELAPVSRSSEDVKKVATAAILASLSLAASPIAATLPRIPGWEIAILDPVSFFWVIAFLMGGLWVGLLSVGVGTIGLFFFDPTGYGPFFKLEATLPMILIPYLFVMLFGRKREGSDLSAPKFFFSAMAVGTIIRLVLMIITNLIAVPILYGPWPPEAIISYAFVLNLSQSFWDALIPYLIVFATPLFKRFGMW